MQVGEDQLRIGLERVENAVAVMGVDVDVRDPPQAVARAQQLDRDTAVVEDAETRRMATAGVVQAGDRHETATRLAGHDRVHRLDRAAYHVARRLEHAPVRRGVAAIQPALPRTGAFANLGDQFGGMEGEQFLLGRRTRLLDLGLAVQAAGLELPVERAVPVRTEGMPFAEAVARQLLAGDHEDIRTHRVAFAA